MKLRRKATADMYGPSYRSHFNILDLPQIKGELTCADVQP